MSEVVQALQIILTAAVALYGAIATYRLGRQKNLNDKHKLDLDAQAARLQKTEEEQKRLREEAEERKATRKAERDQDRLDRESALAQVREDRKADQQLVIFQRETINNIYEDIKSLRFDNAELSKQVIVLTKNNDILQRDFALSEKDRKSKTADLTLAQTQLAQVTEQLIEANHTIADLKREMEVQHTAHDTEMKHINEVSDLQLKDVQRQLDQMREDHHKQLNQLQISEGPRNLEVTRLRYTLREVNRRMTQEQVEEVTGVLMEQGLSYDGLLFPKPDPILVVMTQPSDALAAEMPAEEKKSA